jgi:hypothetical protein
MIKLPKRNSLNKLLNNGGYRYEFDVAKKLLKERLVYRLKVLQNYQKILNLKGAQTFEERMNFF